MEWEEIQRIGRELYNLSEDWILCGADASDSTVMKIEFGRKGIRGGWLRGKQNTFKGYISNYKQYMA